MLAEFVGNLHFQPRTASGSLLTPLNPPVRITTPAGSNVMGEGSEQLRPAPFLS
jgi:hypothetical protein